ncbi:MAG: hypothetical protein JWM68_1991 [Verrucomicrobiales bacterium]|nr:hypothetical protein [Verrucomicrobiales bacterium]
MPMTRPTPIDCEQCHTEQMFVMRMKVNVTSQPQDKEDLLAGKLNTFVCPKCRFTKMYDFPLFYEDRKRRLMILVVPPPTEVIHKYPPPGVVKTTQLRMVSSRNELIEKILIRDAKLDDRVVEFMKVQVRFASLSRSIPVDGHLMFSGVVKNDDDEDVVQFQDVTGASDDTFLSLPLPYYRKFAKALKPFIAQILTPDTLWLRVDHDYGQQLDRLVDKAIEKEEEVEKPRRKKRRR